MLDICEFNGVKRTCVTCDTSSHGPLLGFSIEALGGTDYCELHFPSSLNGKPTAKQSWPQARHDTIASRLADSLSSKERVNLNDASVFSEIAIRGKTLAALEFERCQFKAGLSLYDCTFSDRFVLQRCEVQAFIARQSVWIAPFSALECDFGQVLLVDCTFHRDTRFSKSKYKENAFAHGVVFNGYARDRKSVV